MYAIWRRDEEERLVHTVLIIHLNSEKSQNKSYHDNFLCNGQLTLTNLIMLCHSSVCK